jgi:hypothetical protein
LGNKNNSIIVAPRFIWGTKKTHLPKRLPSTLSPAPLGAGENVEFARYKIIYILLNPTPKGVGYDILFLIVLTAEAVRNKRLKALTMFYF